MTVKPPNTTVVTVTGIAGATAWVDNTLLMLGRSLTGTGTSLGLYDTEINSDIDDIAGGTGVVETAYARLANAGTVVGKAGDGVDLGTPGSFINTATGSITGALEK